MHKLYALKRHSDGPRHQHKLQRHDVQPTQSKRRCLEHTDFVRLQHDADTTDERVGANWLKHAAHLGLPRRIHRRLLNPAGELAYDCYWSSQVWYVISLEDLAAHFGDKIVGTIFAYDETVGVCRRVEHMQLDCDSGLYHVQWVGYPRVFDQHLTADELGEINYDALQCFRWRFQSILQQFNEQ